MSVVTFTPDGIQRANVERTSFFELARAQLLEAGATATVWADYLSIAPGIHATIRPNKILLTGGPFYSTVNISKVIALVRKQRATR